MSVKWRKPNDFTYCANCKRNEWCPLYSKRVTAGCNPIFIWGE